MKGAKKLKEVKQKLAAKKKKQSKFTERNTLKFSIGIENLELEVGAKNGNIIAGFSVKLKEMSEIGYEVSVPNPVNAFLVGVGIDFLKHLDKDN